MKAKPEMFNNRVITHPPLFIFHGLTDHHIVLRRNSKEHYVIISQEDKITGKILEDSSWKI
ncbi:MAG: hypothetical protein C0402_02285 [Thermodesulfovibrio sp.]|nr:hypothetical protein [Thermodesulfovibrio sp.]